MDASDSGEFTRRLVGLGELFDADLSPVKQALYFEALKDLHLIDVLEGLDRAVRECKFMPKPVEIRALAVGSVEDQAEHAWVEFKDEMRRLGAYGNPIFDAALAYAITDTFGTWPAACAADLSPEMWASKRKEFCRSYQRHQRHESPNHMRVLAGCFGLESGAPASRVYVIEAVERKELPACDH